MNFIDVYAQTYSLDPDWVFSNTKFGTLTNLIIKWRKYDRYQSKFNEYKKLMSPHGTTK